MRRGARERTACNAVGNEPRTRSQRRPLASWVSPEHDRRMRALAVVLFALGCATETAPEAHVGQRPRVSMPEAGAPPHLNNMVEAIVDPAPPAFQYVPVRRQARRLIRIPDAGLSHHGVNTLDGPTHSCRVPSDMIKCEAGWCKCVRPPPLTELTE